MDKDNSYRDFGSYLKFREGLLLIGVKDVYKYVNIRGEVIWSSDGNLDRVGRFIKLKESSER